MRNSMDTADEGFRFFGKVTASLSHEIRNVLATLYENAGLVEDLSLMAERGRPLVPERIKDLAGKMKAQVRRGREIADHMNRFAHSVDEASHQVDVGELIEQVAFLARRNASMRQVTLEANHAGEPVSVKTDAFLLENLVWHCLDYSVRSLPAPGPVRLTSEAARDGAVIHFHGLPKGKAPSIKVFPEPGMEILRRAIGADLTLNEDSGEIILFIPGRSQED